MDILTQGYVSLVRARHGLMLVNRNDRYIGQSLLRYGEFSDAEIDLLRAYVGPGDTVVEVGSNIGAHTVPLGRLVGAQGRVLAFEPQYFVHQILGANLALNGLTQVRAQLAACGDTAGRITVPVLDPSLPENFGGLGLGRHPQGDVVPLLTLDSLDLPSLRLLKADVEGMELQVLRGARQTIERCRPVLYVENDRSELSPPLIGLLFELGYDCHWHFPPLFNPKNFLGTADNVFPGIVSCNMLCVPRGQAVPDGLGLQRVDSVDSNWKQVLASLRSTEAPARTAAAGWIAQATQALDRGDPAAARLACEQAGSTHEPDLPALAQLAGVAISRSNWPVAVTALQHMLRLRPDDPALLGNLGAAHGQLKQHEQAADCFARAVALDPTAAEQHFNLGNALRELGRGQPAIASCRRGLQLGPDIARGHLLLANALADEGQFQAAQQHYETAIRLQPQNALAHKNLGILLLRLGDMQRGWQAYEWRFAADGLTPPESRFAQPLWDGRPLQGRTLLLTGEQGLGDQIQFLRYASGIEGRVVIQVHDRLVRLLGRDFPNVIGTSQKLPAFDVHAPLMSLPHILGRPQIAVQTPYLTADPARVLHWRQRLAGVPRRRVGIAWQGNREQHRDNQRSIPLALLAPLSAIKGLHWVSLQKGDGQEQIASSGWQRPITDLSAEMDTGDAAFVDSAAVMHELDLVITIDSAIAHVAGALGRPTWLLTRAWGDWRWQLDGEHTAWYPAMTVLRQPVPQDWASILPLLQQRLQALAQPPRS